MDRIFEKTLLYDFYGELLTERQKEIYENVVFNDMSLSEAAEEYGISRQGVHDMIHRCDQALQNFEDKLHAVEQFETVKGTVLQMKEVLLQGDGNREKLLELLDSILNEI